MKVPALVNPTSELSNNELRRYGRHIVIPQFGAEAQSRLKTAKVLCIGAGGLGSPALIYLAAAGVGTLGVVDFDVVDESNLQRQIIFGQSDIGRSKVEVAQERLLSINPNITVNIYGIKIDVNNVLSIMSEYDIVIDATDNFATRYLINDAAVLLNKPCVWGSVNRFDGQAAIFWSAYGPCYRCIHPKAPDPTTVQNCAEAGVLGNLCALVASMQVNEVVKAITGIGELAVGKLMIYDALSSENSVITIRKNPACVICGENPKQTGLLENYEEFCGIVSAPEITASELQDKVNSKEDFLLIDVREADEFEQSRIPGSVLIPQGFFLDLSALSQLPKDKEIILHCRSGVRSATCLGIIQSKGFTNSRHLRGGILEWEKL